MDYISVNRGAIGIGIRKVNAKCVYNRAFSSQRKYFSSLGPVFPKIITDSGIRAILYIE